VYELDGQVLLIGVDHSANTTVHLAENLAGVRYRLPKQLTVLSAGVVTRLDYAEIDHCCANFESLSERLDARGLQRHGYVGQAPARLIRSRDIVAVALAKLNASETAFLHPAGVCAECDDARASLPPEPQT
jgi:aminoglycoside 3-N-acetyltransferase